MPAIPRGQAVVAKAMVELSTDPRFLESFRQWEKGGYFSILVLLLTLKSLWLRKTKKKKANNASKIPVDSLSLLTGIVAKVREQSEHSNKGEEETLGPLDLTNI